MRLSRDPAPPRLGPVDLQLTTATADDLPALALADGRAFGAHPTDPEMIDEMSLVDPARFLLARERGRIVGATGDFPFRLTVPGGAAVDIAGVSWVSVAVTHRRRGVLGVLMAAQHRRHAEAGLVMTALTAVEGGIYGRFGYGPATAVRTVEIDRTRARFSAAAPDPGGVWEAGADEARTHAPAVHERWCRGVPGALSRGADRWDLLAADRPETRHGGSGLFFLLHPGGYAAYRIERGERCARVVDLFAATDEAHVALWRVLLALEPATTVRARCPVDDPLPFLLTDPRLVRTVSLADGLWLRLLDVPAALAARTYGVEVDVVLDLADTFLDRGGRFRLRGGPQGAECAPTDRPADVHTDVASLAALYLGGHRGATLARAALLRADDPAPLRRLDLALATERAPEHGTHF